MIRMIAPEYADVMKCAEVYITAYSVEPWNEKYNISDVEKYIVSFLDSNTKC